MKKIFIFCSLLFPIFVNANSMDFGSSLQECLSFDSKNVTASGTGTHNYCIKETCSNGVWQSSFTFNRNTLVCSNGNTDFYYYTISSGCTNYVGTCSTNNSINYCGIVVGYDCNKINNGSIYVPKTTSTTSKTYVPPTIKPTTKTTKRTNTTKTTQKTTTTTTTTTTTMPVKDSNSYLKSLKVEGYSFEFIKEQLSYEIVVEKDIKNLDITYETESDKASVTISNNQNIDINKPIIIKVTAEDGSIKDYTIDLKLKNLSNNTNVNITISNYDFAFDQSQYEYDLKINKEDTVLVFNIDLEDNNATYEVEGNSDLKDGSKIYVKIIAEDETSNLYTFNIIKDAEVKKKSNAPIVILIILLLGIMGVVAFKFIRRIIPAKEDEKYDYE